MTSRTVKKPSDVTKSKQDYIDNLTLEIKINKANEEAVRIYKLTGQLPPSTEMKDTRTVSEILLDTEKLKINLIKDLEAVANPQFAQQIVNRLIQSPLNINGELLIYTAQRAPDLVKNLKQLYKYGIKGDANDAEQFVSFMAKYYADRNKMASNAKGFMSRMGSANVGSLGQRLKLQHESISRISSQVIASKYMIEEAFGRNLGTGALFVPDNQEMTRLVDSIVKKLVTLGQIMPDSPDELSHYERLLINKEGTASYDADNDRYHQYIDFINNNIPNLEIIEVQYEQFVKSLNIIKSQHKQFSTSRAMTRESIDAVRVQIQKCNDVLKAIIDQLSLNDSDLRRMKDIFANIRRSIGGQEFYENPDLGNLPPPPPHGQNMDYQAGQYPSMPDIPDVGGNYSDSDDDDWSPPLPPGSGIPFGSRNIPSSQYASGHYPGVGISREESERKQPEGERRESKEADIPAQLVSRFPWQSHPLPSHVTGETRRPSQAFPIIA